MQYQFWLCLLLTLLGYLPGIIYAVCTVCEEVEDHHDVHHHKNVTINVRYKLLATADRTECVYIYRLSFNEMCVH
jgi:hypothetical protein